MFITALWMSSLQVEGLEGIEIYTNAPFDSAQTIPADNFDNFLVLVQLKAEVIGACLVFNTKQVNFGGKYFTVSKGGNNFAIRSTITPSQPKRSVEMENEFALASFCF